MGNNKKYKELKRLRRENKSLKEKLKATEEKCLRYEKEMINSTVVERWKIGQYLHDNLAQQLTSAKISISLLKDELSKENLTTTCEEIVNIIDESINEVRDLSHDIIPMDVEKEGVAQAFHQLKLQAERQYSITCILEAGEMFDKITEREVATNLYHIAQEALKNAVNHGGARNVKIAITEHNQLLQLDIKDDGKGFDPANTEGGMGITIIKHRAKEIGGKLRIRKAKEENYTICVSCILPLKSLTGEGY